MKIVVNARLWIIVAIALLLALLRPTGVSADSYDSTTGIWDHDYTTYRDLQISSCQEARQLIPDIANPPADPGKLRRAAHLFAQCQHALVLRHMPIGVLRVNNLGFGATCVAYALVGGDPLPDCNDKSYLPEPHG